MTKNNWGPGRVLVVGMGISGIATALRLRRAGWTAVLVEKAPARRSGGYMVAMFGAGHAAAGRLGILDNLHDRTSSLASVEMDRAGRRYPGMSLGDAPGAPWIMMRGDVEQAAFSKLPEDVEVRYSTTPTAIEQDDDGVDVTLLDTASDTSYAERFDLVVGADGLRSTVRRLVFGPHEDYLKRLNYMIAAFELPSTPVGVSEGQSAMLLEPDRGVTLFGFADHAPTALLSYKTDDVDAEFTQPAGRRLRTAFGPEPLGDTLSEVIDAFESADEVLFDSAEQVEMEHWYRGRVVLVGDAAWCVTLYAGMGVSSGLSGAEVLGAAVERHPGDIAAALAEWEQTMRPHITEYQASAIAGRGIFVPDGRPQILLRRAMSWVMQYSLGRRLLGRFGPADFAAKNVDIAATMRAPKATETPVRTDDAVLA